MLDNNNNNNEPNLDNLFSGIAASVQGASDVVDAFSGKTDRRKLVNPTLNQPSMYPNNGQQMMYNNNPNQQSNMDYSNIGYENQGYPQQPQYPIQSNQFMNNNQQPIPPMQSQYPQPQYYQNNTQNGYYDESYG